MKTFAYTLDLKNNPEIISAYKEYHKKVWPEVLKSIRSSGVKTSKIFLLGTRLFLIIEAEEDFNFLGYTTGQKEKDWDELMRSLQCPVKEAKPGEWWAEMELVYDLEAQLESLSD